MAACGETLISLLNQELSDYDFHKCEQQIIIKRKECFKQYTETKQVKQFQSSDRLEFFNEREEEESEDERAYDFEELEKTHSEIIDSIKERIDKHGQIGLELSIDDQYTEFIHCFVVSKENGEYLLKHTYVCEIKELSVTPFSFSKFQELLESGGAERWKEIFGVEEISVRDGTYWELHVITID